MREYDDERPINVGWGEDVSIAELAELIARTAVGFPGKLTFDKSKPDGPPRKLLDVSRLTALGWAPRTSLESGLGKTLEWYLANRGRLRGCACPGGRPNSSICGHLKFPHP